jgi:hypothetical protein
MVSGGKSLQDQVGEIQKLMSDASETLRQASWAMETLLARLAETADAIELRTRAELQRAGAEPQPEGPVAVSRDLDAGPLARDAASAGVESVVRGRRRRRRWVRGSQGPPSGRADG